MSPTQIRTTEFEVKVGGTVLRSLDPTMAAAVEEIVVDENLHLPAMATVRLHVNNHDWLQGTQLVEGKELEIAAVEHGAKKPLFKGRLSALELDFDEQHPVLILRGYDLSYKLHRIIHRRAFIQETDSGLATRLGQEAGVTVSADSTPLQHEYIFQNNISNYEFLRERARCIGYELYYEDGTLYFKRPHQRRGATIALEWGSGLKRFRSRITTFEPPDEVTVRGWDPKTKKEIVGRQATANGLPQLGAKENGKQQAGGTWGSAKFFVTDRVVQTQNEAESLAQAYLDELGGSFVEAEGLCDGTAAIRPGRTVQIKGVGVRYNGTYTVTAARHTFSNRGHQTAFTVNARRAGTVAELLNGTRPAQTWNGPVVGIVTNINDPEKQGKIKVKFPWLADDQESHWARIATPMAGKARGFHFLPEVNDEVLVMFEHGDMRRPIIIGSLWNGKDDPPVPPALPRGRDDQILKGGASVKQRLIKSTVGNMLIFNDDDSNPGVYMVGKSGAFIMIDDKSGDEIISIKDKTRKNQIEIWSKDNSIHVLCEGDIIVETKANLKATVQGKADIDVTGNITVKSQANISLKATGNIDVEATGNLTLKGMSTTIQGQTTMDVKGVTTTVDGTGMNTVKGATVNVQGTGAVSVSAPAIKLN